MAKNKEKKMVLVIVEGETDAESLTVSLSEVFANEEVAVEITRQDITTEWGSSRSDIRSRVGAVVKNFLDGTHAVRRKDILRVMHIVDTDGAFVPDQAVKEDAVLAEFRENVYEENGIRTWNKAGIERRNKMKAKALRDLVKMKSVLGSIPYRVYFMSCNLEHVLHDKMNCDIEEKNALALRFARHYRQDVEGFKAFIADSLFSLKGEYVDTWKAIDTDLESLKRHTNLGLAWEG